MRGGTKIGLWRFSCLGPLALMGVAACAPEVPYAPTWEKDMRPLMVARCVRCHDGSVGHRDPLSAKFHTVLTVAAFSPNLNYRTRADIPEPTFNTIREKISDAVRGKLDDLPIMPPPPAEKLEDWEIETIDNWVANPR